MSADTYPHTIENGAGERLTFLRRAGAARKEHQELERYVVFG